MKRTVDNSVGNTIQEADLGGGGTGWQLRAEVVVIEESGVY